MSCEVLNRPTLIETMPNSFKQDFKGFIYYLKQTLTERQDDIPLFLQSDETNEMLDVSLIYQKCGYKIIAKIVEIFLNENNQLDVEKIKSLSYMIYIKNIANWNNIFESLTTKYNILDSKKETKTRTPNLQHDETRNIKSKVTNTNQVSGYNSEAFTNLNQSINSGEMNDNEETRTTKETGNEKIESSGSDIPSQDLILKELDLRTMNNFYDIILKSFDDYLTLKIWL